jgi:secreted trypsin-like serine protease
MTAVTDPDCSDGNGCNSTVAPGGEFVAGGTGTADSCFGDSGGPVYFDTANGAVVVGAVSRGVDNASTPCGGGGIYVRTDKIVQWLETTTGKTIAKDTCGGSGEEDEAEVDNDEIGGCSTSSGAGLAVVVAFAFVRRRSSLSRTKSAGGRTTRPVLRTTRAACA